MMVFLHSLNEMGGQTSVPCHAAKSPEPLAVSVPPWMGQTSENSAEFPSTATATSPEKDPTTVPWKLNVPSQMPPRAARRRVPSASETPVATNSSEGRDEEGCFSAAANVPASATIS